jgi:hypothetical protein
MVKNHEFDWRLEASLPFQHRMNMNIKFGLPQNFQFCTVNQSYFCTLCIYKSRTWGALYKF